MNIYNLGTGRGTSVLELVHSFEVANKILIPYEIVSRRAGYIATCYAVREIKFGNLLLTNEKSEYIISLYLTCIQVGYTYLNQKGVCICRSIISLMR